MNSLHEYSSDACATGWGALTRMRCISNKNLKISKTKISSKNSRKLILDDGIRKLYAKNQEFSTSRLVTTEQDKNKNKNKQGSVIKLSSNVGAKKNYFATRGSIFCLDCGCGQKTQNPETYLDRGAQACRYDL